MFEFITLTHKHEEEWTAFVNDNINGNIFQTIYYYDLLSSEKKNIPFAYGVLEDGEILGIIVGAIESNLRMPFHLLTRRLIIRGGPLLKDDNEERVRFLLTNMILSVGSECIFLQIRNLWPTQNLRNIFQELKFNYTPHLDIIIDLQRDNETIISSISKNKRGNINKSKNKGTVFKEITDFLGYKQAIKLLQVTYRRVKLPLPSPEFFVHAFVNLTPQNILKVFAAYYNNEMIGVRLELCYKNLIYDWYAGSDENHKNKYPNDFLPYHILLWGKANNYKYFDFGGAGKPGIPYGVRDHKMKFGGELVEFGRYERINNNLLFKLGRIGIKLRRKI